MPQGIPTGHSWCKRIYAFAVLARAGIGKRHVPRRRRKALLRVPVGGNAARHSHRTLMLQADLRIRPACRSVHRKKTRTAPQAQGAFASARRGQCRKAFPPDTHASAPAVFGLLRRVATLDKKESAFFSHYDPNIVEWFVKMVEERKKHHDSSKEKKAW